MFCNKCGNDVPDYAANCTFCGAPMGGQADFGGQSSFDGQSNYGGVSTYRKPENVLAGTVGALIGAVIGGAAIIGISQLGYVASIAGVILAVCTLKGYELLGGTMSTKGAIISLILIALTPYLADRIDWAIVVYREFQSYGVTFGECFSSIHVLIEEDIIDAGTYGKTLGMLYAFTALGAVSTIASAFKGAKK